MSILNKSVILKLNKNWVPIGFGTPYQCIAGIFSGALVPLNMEYTPDDSAEFGFDFSSPMIMEPIDDLDLWCALEPSKHDPSLNLPSGKKFKVPSVVICCNYNKIPYTVPKLSKRNVMIRDGYMCQYSGIRYDKRDLNIDHVVPKSKGGKSSWQNLVTCHKDVNTKKGNLTLAEFYSRYSKYRLIKTPTQPTTFTLNLGNATENPLWGPFVK